MMMPWMILVWILGAALLVMIVLWIAGLLRRQH